MKQKYSKFLKEFVYGGTDGIITTFAVVSGYLGVVSVESTNSIETSTAITSSIVLFFGLANLFADATSMGLGDYLSNQSNNSSIKRFREIIKRKLTNTPKKYLIATEITLLKKGFSNNEAKEMASIISKNPEFWEEFIVKIIKNKEYHLDNDGYKSALATFIAFMFFGTIPLIPFLLPISDSIKGMISVGFTALALSLLGLLRWFFTKEKLFIPILETLSLGGLAALIAYLVGVLIGV